MKTVRVLFAMAIALLAMTSCNNAESSTPLGKLCGVYEKIGENNQEVMNFYQEAKEARAEELEQLVKQKEAENAELAQEAKTLAAELKDSEIAVEVDPTLGYKVDKMLFSTVDANINMANIVIKGTAVGSVPEGSVYVFMLNKNGEVVTKTIGMKNSDNAISVNFHITTRKGPEVARIYGSVTSIKVVTEAEYKTGNKTAEPEIAEDAPEDNAPAVEEAEPDEEAEPAYIGDETASSASVTVNGITIKKGDPVVATLRKFDNISWEYNADIGIIAHVGNVMITVEDFDDLTASGIEYMKTVYSDIEPNLKFSVDYIKPTAKITRLEKN